ncbi:MAG: hypothetical protein WC729_03985 [Sphingomonas sp.]|uniref:hypothetical protein n=1 Tax=Sphingomonas sp. TaxID=28214 RepID=UPI00356B10BA
MDKDVLQIGAFFAGAALLLMLLATLAFSYFIVPQAAPTKRASWITGLAYFLSVVGVTIAIDTTEGSPKLSIPADILFPVAALPAALFVFLYWRWTFRRAWIDDDNIPEGVEINDDDWRTGLLRLAIVVLVALGVGLVRFLIRGEARGLF